MYLPTPVTVTEITLLCSADSHWQPRPGRLPLTVAQEMPSLTAFLSVVKARSVSTLRTDSALPRQDHF